MKMANSDRKWTAYHNIWFGYNTSNNEDPTEQEEEYYEWDEMSEDEYSRFEYEY